MNPLTKFKKGAIIAHILYHATKMKIYGSWLKEELSNHGYNLSYGTLYPWLNELAADKILECEEVNVKGKIRKYYGITQKGREQFDEIKKYLKELYNEIM